MNNDSRIDDAICTRRKQSRTYLFLIHGTECLVVQGHDAIEKIHLRFY